MPLGASRLSRRCLGYPPLLDAATSNAMMNIPMRLPTITPAMKIIRLDISRWMDQMPSGSTSAGYPSYSVEQ